MTTMSFEPGTTEPSRSRSVARGARAVLAKVTLALETNRGDWPTDVRFGLPLVAWAENPATPILEIESTIRQTIEDVPGVISVDNLTVTRFPSITAEARITVQGDTDTEQAAISAEQEEISDPRLIVTSTAIGTTRTLLPTAQGLTQPDRPARPVRGVLPLHAWAAWDPCLTPGTYATYYTALADLTYNNRDLTNDGNVGITTGEYYVNGQRQVLPEPDGSSDLIYDNGGPFTGESFAVLMWGHHDTALSDGQFLGSRYLTTTAGQVAFGFEWYAAGSRLRPSGQTFVPGSPQPTVPSSPGSKRAWYAMAIRRWVDGSKSYWKWVMVADWDDGLGVREITSSTWTETTSQPGAWQTQFDNGEVLALQEGTKEAGGAAWWDDSQLPDENELESAVVWAARRFSERAERDTAVLLGVT